MSYIGNRFDYPRDPNVIPGIAINYLINTPLVSYLKPGRLVFYLDSEMKILLDVNAELTIVSVLVPYSGWCTTKIQKIGDRLQEHIIVLDDQPVLLFSELLSSLGFTDFSAANH